MARLNRRAERNLIADRCLLSQVTAGDEVNVQGLWPQQDPEHPGYEVFPDPNEVCYCWWIHKYEKSAWHARN